MSIFNMKKLFIYSLSLVVMAILCTLSFYAGIKYKTHMDTILHEKPLPDPEAALPPGEVAMMCMQGEFVALLFIDQQKILRAATNLTISIDHNILIMSKFGTPYFDSFYFNKEDRNIIVYNKYYKPYLNLREKYKYKEQNKHALENESAVLKTISKQRPTNQSELEKDKEGTKKLITKILSEKRPQDQ